MGINSVRRQRLAACVRAWYRLSWLALKKKMINMVIIMWHREPSDNYLSFITITKVCLFSGNESLSMFKICLVSFFSSPKLISLSFWWRLLSHKMIHLEKCMWHWEPTDNYLSFITIQRDCFFLETSHFRCLRYV